MSHRHALYSLATAICVLSGRKISAAPVLIDGSEIHHVDSALYVPKNRKKTAKFAHFSRKTNKTRRKPVEIRCFPLTNASESRKVNGARVSETRINPVDPCIGSWFQWEMQWSPEAKHAVVETIAVNRNRRN